MDEKDVRILYAALEAKTKSPDRIAELTDIPKSTVHYRLDNLRDEGIVQNELFDVDLDELGLSLRVISEVRAVYDEGYHERVGEKLAAIEGVNQVYFTMGDTDFVVIATISSREMVESLISEYESIDAVERTSSKFVISTVKGGDHPLTDFDVETLLEHL